MRLGQLARKLDIKVNQIVEFLEDEHQIHIESDLNTKLDDDILLLVKDNFIVVEEVINDDELIIDEDSAVSNVMDSVTDEISSDIEENVLLSDEVEISVVDVNSIETDIEEEVTVEVVDSNKEEEKLFVEDENGERIELNVVDGVIKAPKKELSGFKVVGKIELEKPKKSVQHIKTEGLETTNITDEISTKRKEVAQLKREKYLKRKADKKKQQEKRKKGRKRRVLSELEIKEKQAELLVQKRLEQAKIDKNKKKKHYEQIAKAKQVSKPKKKKGKKVDESVVKTVKQFEKEPTTRLGKIWKWFNT